LNQETVELIYLDLCGDLIQNDVDGYHFVGWYVNTRSTDFSCEDPQGTTFPSNFRVTTDNVEITLCNARDTGDLTIVKAVDSDGDGDVDFHNTGWTYDIDVGNQNYAMGSTQTLATGNYTVNEDQQTNYHSIGWRCTDGTSGLGETLNVEVTTQGVTCTFANTRDTGDLKVNKEVDTDGDGTFESGNGRANILGFMWGLDSGSDVTLVTGSYSVTENDVDGYHFVGWYTNGPGADFSCEDPQGTTFPSNFRVTTDNVEITLCNARDTGDLKVNKKVDTDGDGTFESGNGRANTIGFMWGLDSETPGRAMGSDETVVTDTYDVTENYVAGYHFVGWYENGSKFTCETTTYNTLPTNLEVTDDGIEITLCNARDTGDLLIKKFNDLNENGQWDEGEPFLADWSFAVTQNSTSIDGGQTGGDGTLLIENLPTGTYDVTEILNSDWLNTTGLTQQVTIVYNETTTVMFGNAEKEVTLDLDKTNDKNIVGPSETINYRVDWSIDGNSTAVNVVLTDTLPVKVVVDESSISDGGTYSASEHKITWDLGNQEPGASGFVTYTVTTVETLADGTEIINVARISADNTDPKFKEDDTKVVVEVAPILTIDKTDNKEWVNPGDTVIYTVTVANTGTETAYNVELTDLLPPDFTFVDFEGGTHTWSLGDLAAGDDITVTFKVTVGEDVTAGYYENLAVASADNHGNVSDTEPVNVRIPKVLAEEAFPNLVIEKSVDKEFINAGDTVTFTVKVSNVGDAEATSVAVNVQLQDVMPAGFTFEDGEVTKVWSLGDIAVGEFVEKSYKAVSDTTILPGMYENLAIAWADNHDKISDSEDVEVREPIILGEELPTTGGGILQYMYILIAGLLLAFALYTLKLTRSKEQSK